MTMLRWVCSDCGTPWAPGAPACPACRSLNHQRELVPAEPDLAAANPAIGVTVDESAFRAELDAAASPKPAPKPAPRPAPSAGA